MYRLHTLKTQELCGNGFANLNAYLSSVFDLCPHAYFQGGPRGSALKFKLPFQPTEVVGHEVSNLAKWGLLENRDRFGQAHPRVQHFMLENDMKTVAMEVPIWLEHHEMNDFTSIFSTFQPLTGHIDILRVDDEKIWIWDYKPNAHKERYAATQILFYAIMLSKRTGIPLELFRCGYFDKSYAYVFKPEHEHLKKNSTLNGYQQTKV